MEYSNYSQGRIPGDTAAYVILFIQVLLLGDLFYECVNICYVGNGELVSLE